MAVYTDLCQYLKGLSLYFNEITGPDLTRLILVNSGRGLTDFIGIRLAGHDLSMATSEHRKNGNCTYNLSRYQERLTEYMALYSMKCKIEMTQQYSINQSTSRSHLMLLFNLSQIWDTEL